jgi:hypothetical protein
MEYEQLNGVARLTEVQACRGRVFGPFTELETSPSLRVRCFRGIRHSVIVRLRLLDQDMIRNSDSRECSISEHRTQFMKLAIQLLSKFV